MVDEGVILLAAMITANVTALGASAAWLCCVASVGQVEAEANWLARLRPEGFTLDGAWHPWGATFVSAWSAFACAWRAPAFALTFA